MQIKAAKKYTFLIHREQSGQSKRLFVIKIIDFPTMVAGAENCERTKKIVTNSNSTSAIIDFQLTANG